MKYNLFLDDERFPHLGGDQMSAYDLTGDKQYKLLDWVIVRNFEDFVKTIEKNGLPEVISFDHDLKDQHYYYYRMYTFYTGWIDYEVVEGSGYECTKWLINYLLNNDLKSPEILIHTQNIIGAKNIKKEFENFKKHNK